MSDENVNDHEADQLERDNSDLDVDDEFPQKKLKSAKAKQQFGEGPKQGTRNKSGHRGIPEELDVRSLKSKYSQNNKDGQQEEARTPTMIKNNSQYKSKPDLVKNNKSRTRSASSSSKQNHDELESEESKQRIIVGNFRVLRPSKETNNNNNNKHNSERSSENPSSKIIFPGSNHRILQNSAPPTSLQYKGNSEKWSKNPVQNNRANNKNKSSIAVRSGKYLKKKLIPQPKILTAVPPEAPVKTFEEDFSFDEWISLSSGNPSKQRVKSSSNTSNQKGKTHSSSHFTGSGITSNKSKGTKSSETFEVEKISEDTGKINDKTNENAESRLKLEELYVDLENEGTISDINSAISLMVRQRSILRDGEAGRPLAQQQESSESLHLLLSSSGFSHKKEISKTSGKLFHMNVITKENLGKVRWSDAYEHLTIKGCLRSITWENIAKSRKTLTVVKFVQITTFPNLRTILENCSNLIRLSFANIAVVEKNKFNPKSQPIISLCQLEELELQEWLYSLTKYEYWILDFLTRGCSFGKLEKFVFQGRENVMSGKKISIYQKQLKNLTDPAVVTKFLVKNQATLKKVSIGGIGFQLIESSNRNSRFVNALTNVQLNSLRLDLQTPGIEFLLLKQRRLVRLSCAGCLQSFDTRTKQWIHQFLQNNQTTLTHLGIFPCVICDISKENRPNLFQLDCEMFRNCKKLESFFLNISTARSQLYTERFSSGSLIHIHLLPISLVEIELHAGMFRQADLDDLFKRLPMFRKLRDLSLSCAVLFDVSAVFISNLSLMDALLSAKFHGGKFLDADTMQRIVRKQGIYNMDLSDGNIVVTKKDHSFFSLPASYRTSLADNKKS